MLRFRKKNRVVGGKLRELRNRGHEIRSEIETQNSRENECMTFRLI